jgi:hypothetical protein
MITQSGHDDHGDRPPRRLTRAEQRAISRRAFERLKHPLPDVPPTPAEEEAFLADLALLSGADAETVQYVYATEPDGSRIEALKGIVHRLLGGEVADAAR